MRNVCKRSLFALLAASGANAIYAAAHRGRVKTIIYHNVLPQTDAFPFALSPIAFESQLVAIKRFYNPVSLTQSGEIVGSRRDRINVLLTFDDGFVNNYEFAFPLLIKHGLKATFFVIGDCVERGVRPSLADRYAKRVSAIGDDRRERIYRTIDVEQIRQMAAAGMSFGSHSANHDDFSLLSFREGLEQAVAANDRLAEMLKMEMKMFAFPWGRYHPGQPEALARTFKRVFTTSFGFNTPTDRIMHRNEAIDALHLRAATSGSLDLLRRMRSSLLPMRG